MSPKKNIFLRRKSPGKPYLKLNPIAPKSWKKAKKQLKIGSPQKIIIGDEVAPYDIVVGGKTRKL